MNDTTKHGDGFDTAAAVTRSLLGWGVVVGVFYFAVSIVQGLVRDGFDFSEHQLSLLTLGENGWVQTVNFILSGLMTLAAAVGFIRVARAEDGSPWPGRLVGVFGACLILSGIFRPDAMAGFPAGEPEEATASGILHLVVGAVGFLCVAAAAFAVARWQARRDERSRALWSRIAGAVVVVGFVGGGALSTSVAGVVALWIAVVTAFAWLAVTSIHLYRVVPHPDLHRRAPADGAA